MILTIFEAWVGEQLRQPHERPGPDRIGSRRRMRQSRVLEPGPFRIPARVRPGRGAGGVGAVGAGVQQGGAFGGRDGEAQGCVLLAQSAEPAASSRLSLLSCSAPQRLSCRGPCCRHGLGPRLPARSGPHPQGRWPWRRRRGDRPCRGRQGLRVRSRAAPVARSRRPRSRPHPLPRSWTSTRLEGEGMLRCGGRGRGGPRYVRSGRARCRPRAGRRCRGRRSGRQCRRPGSSSSRCRTAGVPCRRP